MTTSTTNPISPASTVSMPVLSTVPFDNFKLKTTIASIFLEYQGRVLLLQRSKKEDQSHTWGIPGGKAEANESPIDTVLRELKEETGIKLDRDQVTYHGHRYARIPGWDYGLHMYHAKLDKKPEVRLSKEHTNAEWVSIYGFKLMNLLKGQDEVFDIVYKDRIWQRVDQKTPLQEKTDSTAQLVLQKGDKTLTFSPDRKFVLNLIGTSGSGKGTQGDMLSKLFGIPNISAGDIFRDEFRAKSTVGSMVADYDAKHYPKYLPDEVPVGMVAKRLADPDCKTGFILDGYPRTKTQGDTTREVFLGKGDFHVPLFMDVPEADIWERLPGRSICNECGHQVRATDANANAEFCPQEVHQGKRVKLEKRPEDIDKTKTERRLKMFRDNKEGILTSMEKRDPVTTFQLDNKIPPREVLHRLCGEIQTRLDDLYEARRSANRPNKLLLINSLLAGFVALTYLIRGKTNA